MYSRTYERLAGFCALLASGMALLYAVAFVVLRNALLSGLFLMLLGLLISVVLVALYQRVREVDGAFALWGLITTLVGAFGSAVHGGYDLAVALHPPGPLPTEVATLPNVVDPRGLLTFGVTGTGFFVLAWLIGRVAAFPKGLAWLGFLAASLLIMLYLARLIIVDPTNPLLLVPVLLSGFLILPAWYLWLGAALLRMEATTTITPELSKAAAR